MSRVWPRGGALALKLKGPINIGYTVVSLTGRAVGGLTDRESNRLARALC